MNDLLINTAAIASAMRIDNQLLKQWGHGCVELYDAIGEWAAIVSEEEAHLEAAIEALDDGWPGVFAYEVSEKLGWDLRQRIMTETEITQEWVRGATREQITAYCSDSRQAGAIRDAYLTRSLAETTSQ